MVTFSALEDEGVRREGKFHFLIIPRLLRSFSWPPKLSTPTPYAPAEDSEREYRAMPIYSTLFPIN